MKKIDNPKESTWLEVLKRPTQTFDAIEETVKQIFKEVEKKGDKAVAKYTSLFDGVQLESIIVTTKEINKTQAKYKKYLALKPEIKENVDKLLLQR